MATYNPILTGFNPDPSICRVGDDYFLATSSFEYFPGVPIYHSKDLVNWSLIGHALNRPSQLSMRTVSPGGGIMAPTLRNHKGRFYMTTCTVHRRGGEGQYIGPRGFFVYTDDILDETKWSDPIYFDNLGIDQDLFFGDDGRVYLSTARRTPINNPEVHLVVYCSEIDIATGRNLTHPVVLRESDQVNGIAEGAHIFKRGEWYYLITAEGGTDDQHQQWIFRSKLPLGPYEAAPQGINPIVFNNLDPHVRQTGHMDIIEGKDGQWWAVLLGVRPQRGETGLIASQLGRETFLSPVTWSTEGWPTLNAKEPIATIIKDTTLPPTPPLALWRDDFDKDRIDRNWYHLRTPFRQEYSLRARPGFLTMYGGAYRIQDQENSAMILRRQSAFSGIWSTVLQFSPTGAPDQEAGTCVYWSNWSYAAIILRKAQGDGREIVMRWTDDEGDGFNTREIVRPTSDSASVKLVIEAQPTSYTFKCDGDNLITLPSSILVRRRNGDTPFTGTHFGLFAQGVDGEPSRDPAYFEYASWMPISR